MVRQPGSSICLVPAKREKYSGPTLPASRDDEPGIVLDCLIRGWRARITIVLGLNQPANDVFGLAPLRHGLKINQQNKSPTIYTEVH